MMKLYLIDDRGSTGEYADFLNAHRESLPAFELEVFTHYSPLLDAVNRQMPSAILADMRFDMIPAEELYGDIDALANTEQFCGNRDRAEAQIRGMQGLLVCRLLRERQVRVPEILFASLPPQIAANVTRSLAPIRIIEGLILNDVREALREIALFGG
ncbi:MAG: hypothetical protein II767_03055 [Proteobacteria bacterium]|nr:hypothetical protein [Pseudomonadota bacterium]MBQ4359210.1 hypothetical protein [Pseudomonadota bacterium]